VKNRGLWGRRGQALAAVGFGVLIAAGCGKTASDPAGADGDQAGAAGSGAADSGASGTLAHAGTSAAAGSTSGGRAEAGAAGEAGSESCGVAVPAFTPLFSDGTSPFAPVSSVDPLTHHILFRGAGRLREDHEMQPGFAHYGGSYFEGRTYGFVLDDAVAAGGSTIELTFIPATNLYYSKQALAAGQQGGADLAIRYFKIYGALSSNVFAGNAGGLANNGVSPFGCLADPNGPSCDTRKYVFTITQNEREHRPMQVGDQLQIEFGVELARYGAGSGPPLDNLHVRNFQPLPVGCGENGAPYSSNCYTRTHYFSDPFRYVVGKGTLTPYNQDCSVSVPDELLAQYPEPLDCAQGGVIAQAVAAGTIADRTGPDEAGWSAGSATLPYLRQRHDLYFSQMAPNILQENAEFFVQGRRLFETDFETGENLEPNNGLSPAEVQLHAGLAGPRFNQRSCEGCHSHGNRGKVPAAGEFLASAVVKLFGSGVGVHGEPLPDPHYGHELQSIALGSGSVEGKATLSFSVVPGTFGDGTAYSLHQPTTVLQNLAAGQPQALSTRLARPLIGLGLLEAIPEADLIAHADPNDCDHDGISGVANVVFDPEDAKLHLGRFGSKAAQASLTQQVALDLNLDLGVTSSDYPLQDCTGDSPDCQAPSGEPELLASDLALLVTYVRELAVPARRDVKAPAVMQGEALFTSLGCASCHTPTQHTGSAHRFLELRDQTIHPYTDLLLHDLGAGLADAHAAPEFLASTSEWRTPPLWGIGLCDEVAAGYQGNPAQNPAPNWGPCRYLHDGRAATLLEAVLWHGGEAEAARAGVLALSSAERTALLAFLQSL
jgi:CxxC motif-containing protein (DUF1111 family)